MPKKVEAPVVPIQKPNPTITIDSMEVPIISNVELIMVGNSSSAMDQDEALKVNVEKPKKERDSRYTKPLA